MPPDSWFEAIDALQLVLWLVVLVRLLRLARPAGARIGHPHRTLRLLLAAIFVVNNLVALSGPGPAATGLHAAALWLTQMGEFPIMAIVGWLLGRQAGELP